MSAIATGIARSVSVEAIQRSCCGATGLLRGVYHRAPLRADPLARNDGRFNIFSAFSAVIVREGGRSSSPETSAIDSTGRGVLDAPPARGMTAVFGMALPVIASMSAMPPTTPRPQPSSSAKADDPVFQRRP